MLAIYQLMHDNFAMNRLQTFSSYPTITETLPARSSTEIFETLDELNARLGENSGEFVIIGGANLVLRGIRRATVDVDILVSDDTFVAMKSMEGAQIKLPPKRALASGATNTSVWLNTEWTKIPVSGATDMGDAYYPISYGMYNDTELERVDGHALAPLDHVWGSKVALQRPKDLPDLRLIAAETGRSTVFPAPIYTGPFLNS